MSIPLSVVKLRVEGRGVAMSLPAVAWVPLLQFESNRAKL